MSDSQPPYRCRVALIIAGLCLGAVVWLGVVVFWPAPERDFATRYNQLQPGMSYGEVVKILGPPTRQFFPQGTPEERVAMWDKDGRSVASVKWVNDGITEMKIGARRPEKWWERLRRKAGLR